ncbi:MAG TPA: hypothetical protein VK833_01785, partial [Gillisia sp.]|nr:hypothetical protein [Gillisia sp.]
MKNLRSHFVFSKSQQNGIFLLVILIVLLQLIYFFVDFNASNELSQEDSVRITGFQKQIDSLKQVALTKDTVRVYPFNPNLITDYKGYSLGMSLEEIDRLHEFRKTNKWVNSSKEFQAITLISDSLLNKIAPYFKFPDWVEKSNSDINKKGNNSLKPVGFNIRDLNAASFDDLIMIRGIGEVLASRIIKFISKIGGFLSDI